MNVKPSRWVLPAIALAAGTALVAPPASTAPLNLDDPFHTAQARPVTPASACPALTPTLPELSLPRALALALCQQPQLQAALAEIDLGAAALGEARAAYLPSLSATLSRVADRTGYPDTELTAELLRRRAATAALSWRLFDFGSRAAHRRAAELNLDALIATRDGTVQQVLGNVVKAYFDALTANETYLARSAEQEAAAATAASAARREASGAASRGDALQAAAAHLKAGLERGRAGLAREQALAQLVFALGVPAGTSVTLAPSEAETGGAAGDDLQPDLPVWLEQVRQQHPAIVAARAQLAAAQARVTAATADGRPSLDLQLNYFQNGRPGQSLSALATRELSAGLVLTIPLFDGFAGRYKVRGAVAQVDQRRASLREVEGQILLMLKKSHVELGVAARNLPLGAELLASARQAMQVAVRRYQHGAADLSEVMAAQSALAAARLEHIRCVAEWRAARLNLLVSAGQLSLSTLPP